MASLSLRKLWAVFGLLAAAGCSGPIEGTAPANTTSTPVVTTAPVVATTPTVVAPGPSYVVPPPAVAVPPVAAAPVYPAPPAQVVVPGSGTTLAPVVVPARLNANELAALVANNTVESVGNNGRPRFSYFARDGRLKFRQDSFVDGGSWRVTSDGRLCTSLTRINVGVEDCYTVYRDGANFRYDRPDGTPLGSFAVLPGNPQNL
jgi:hypothetical protein